MVAATLYVHCAIEVWGGRKRPVGLEEGKWVGYSMV